LENLTGQPCRRFRPPFGKLSVNSLVAAWLSNQQVVMWSVDLKDFSAESIESVEERLAGRPLRAGDVLLYHACNPAGIGALPMILEYAKSAGLKATTLTNLGVAQ
jgi:peptidoglycan/xylan/chitin deacetylase (PgdA/CDA1 family)